jgi:hypothetical protein
MDKDIYQCAHCTLVLYEGTFDRNWQTLIVRLDIKYVIDLGSSRRMTHDEEPMYREIYNKEEYRVEREKKQGRI